MRDKIGFIVPTIEYKDKVVKIISRVTDVENIIVEVLDENDIIGQANNMIDNGAVAIIARGGTYHTLKDKISIPVTKYTITTDDILSALSKARSMSPKVYLLLEEIVLFDHREWSKLLDIEIEIRRIKFIDDIERTVNNITATDENAVLVGGVITVKLCKRYNLRSVFIDNKESTILDTFLQVQKIQEDMRRDSKRVRQLESILYNIDNAIIVLSAQGVIENFNRKAKSLLGISDSEVLNRKISEVLPELNYIMNKNDFSADIVEINNLKITVDAMHIEVKGEKLGVICILRDISKIQELEKKLRYKLSRKGLVARYKFNDMIIEEKSMIDLVEKAKKAAASESTIIIYGESGTGKELFAQSIHNYSSRKDAPFVAVNCAALSENLLESELFGYEEGAFTGARKGGKPGLFELAHGGTIFLDEINSISSNLQTKLLRVLEEKEVMRIGSDYVVPLDVRIIAATNEDLIEQVRDNQFRRDLFFRLSVLELKILPLRERKKEILPLFKSFVSILKKVPVKHVEIGRDLEERLLHHKWWGNVRELKNVAERYIIFNDSGELEELFSFNDTDSLTIDDDLKLNINEVNKVVQELIIESLIKQGKTKTDIAKILGISRTALYKKIKCK